MRAYSLGGPRDWFTIKIIQFIHYVAIVILQLLSLSLQNVRLVVHIGDQSTEKYNFA